MAKTLLVARLGQSSTQRMHQEAPVTSRKSQDLRFTEIQTYPLAPFESSKLCFIFKRRIKTSYFLFILHSSSMSMFCG